MIITPKPQFSLQEVVNMCISFNSEKRTFGCWILDIGDVTGSVEENCVFLGIGGDCKIIPLSKVEPGLRPCQVELCNLINLLCG